MSRQHAYVIADTAEVVGGADMERAEVEALWQEALRSADVDPSEVMRFDSARDRTAAGHSAASWPRAVAIDPDESATFEGRFDEADGAEGRTKLRVLLCIGNHSPMQIAGLLRHELEHCRQYREQPELYLLHQRAYEILSKSPAAGLRESNRLYNRIPMEEDANAAAGKFVRTQFGDKCIDDLVAANDPHIALFRSSVGPPAVDSLMERMRRFVLTVGPQLAQEFVRGGTGDPSDSGARDY